MREITLLFDEGSLLSQQNPGLSHHKKGTIDFIAIGFTTAGTQITPECKRYPNIHDHTIWKETTISRGHHKLISNEDLAHVTIPYDDALVVMMEFEGFDIKEILVDKGNSTDNMFLQAFEKMGKTMQGAQNTPWCDQPSSGPGRGGRRLSR